MALLIELLHPILGGNENILGGAGNETIFSGGGGGGPDGLIPGPPGIPGSPGGGAGPGGPPSVDVRGIIVSLSRATDQTEDFSADAQVDFDNADYDPYGGLNAGVWDYPNEIDNHWIFPSSSTRMGDLTGLGTESVSLRTESVTNGGRVVDQTVVAYGASAFNQYLQPLEHITVGQSGGRVRITADSGTDPSSTVNSDFGTYLRVFDFGEVGSGKPKSKTPYHCASLTIGSDITTLNISAGYTRVWDTEVYDTNGFIDLGTNNDRITVPAGMDGWSCLCHSYLTIDDLGDQGWHGIYHLDSGDTIISRGFRYFQHGGIGSGTLVRDTISHSFFDIREGDYFQVRCDSEAGDTSVTMNSGTIPQFTIFFFPPVQGLATPSRD